MDLEPIEERANEFATWVGKFDSAHRIPAAFASAADVPALLAEVKRLRSEVQERDEWLHETAALLPEGFDGDEWEGEVIARFIRQATRPAPTWDEEAMRAASQVLYERLTRIPEFARLDSHVQSDYSNTLARAVLAVVREHLPVKPSREGMAQCLRDALWKPSPWLNSDQNDANRDTMVATLLSAADAILDLWPGRSEATVKAEVKAEVLNEAADWLADMDDGRDTGQHRAGRDIIARLRDRADRLGGNS